MDLQTTEADQSRVREASNLSPVETPVIDIHRQIALFRRRFRLFLGVSGLVFLVGLIFVLMLKPRYSGYVQIMLDPRQQKVVATEQVLSSVVGNGASDSFVVDTEVEKLSSRQLAERVVDQLKLDEDPEYNDVLRPKSLIQRILPQPDLRDTNGIHAAVVDNVMHRVKVVRDGNTYVIRLTAEAATPEGAARLSNAFADMYVAGQLDQKFDAGKRATEWLDRRITELKSQVETAERAVQEYRAKNGLLALNDTMGGSQTGAVALGQTVAQQEMANLDMQLAGAKAQEAEAQARLSTARQQIARGSNGLDVGEALASPIISSLRTQRAQVSGQIADLQNRYGPKHPELMKANLMLSDLDRQIQAEIARVTSNLEAQVQVAHQRTASLEGSIARAKGTLAQNSVSSVQLNELERNLSSVRSLYQYYLDRYKQTSTQQSLEQSDSQIVSRAGLSRTPSFPNIPLFLSLAAFLGLAAGVLVLIIVDTLESGLYTSEDVERELGVPHLGSVPLAGSTPEDMLNDAEIEPISFVAEHPLSSFAEAFRNIRTSLMFSRVGEPVQLIAVTSALPGEGKTTTSICLGRVTAMGGQKTVVVDCDLRRRTVNQMFATKPTVGLLEVLSGRNTLEQALRYDDVSGAYFLPLADAGYTPKDIFASAAMDRLLEELRHRFEVVILDTAPVLPVADTRVLAPKVDAVLFLAQWRKTPRKAIESALRLLDGSGTFIAGVALTQVDVIEQSRSGYGDAYYFYNQYSRYYGEVDTTEPRHASAAE